MVASLDEIGSRSISGRKEEEWSWWHTRINEAQRVKPFFYGDFYPLTVGNHDLQNWLAYHFYLPEKEEGVIVAFRRPKSDVISMMFDLTTIRPEKMYQIEDVDTDETWTLSGQEIRQNGLTVKTTAPRQSRLLFYRSVR